ncbi:hypothetical protein HDU87_004594 [Geranomyces variabilis]|uniref:G-protein coupled receptors family 1 profile domain-containing protein n=1 Tax=Geranomyces variabilis TaxID=109894 RepID=A0AAD5TNE8_9FUNG|nr:hypothetical protein HDU87_004594 [Geranomyces variabilis]
MAEPSAMDGYRAVNITFLVLAPFHLATMALIFHRSYNLRTLTLSQRIPLYACFAELGMLCCFGAVCIYQLATGHNFSQSTCSLIGAFTGYFATVEFMFSGLLAGLTYLNVCRHWQLSTGRFDWRLTAAPVVTCAVMILVIAALQGFGPMGDFGCLMDTTQGKRSSTIAFLLMAMVVLNIVLILSFLIPVIAKLRRTHAAIKRVMLIRIDSGKLVFAPDVNRAALKISVYVLVYSLKWISSIPIYIPILTNPDAPPHSPLTSAKVGFFYAPYILFHLGGIVNGLLYLYCEGLLPSCFARPLARRRARTQIEACETAGWDVGDHLGVRIALEEQRDRFVSVTVPIWTGPIRTGGRSLPRNGRGRKDSDAPPPPPAASLMLRPNPPSPRQGHKRKHDDGRMDFVSMLNSDRVRMANWMDDEEISATLVPPAPAYTNPRAPPFS